MPEKSVSSFVQLLSQERIVFLFTALIFVLFTVLLPGFLKTENLITLTRNVSVLAVLGVGLAIVVIGRGIDLSVVAIMAVSAAWVIKLSGNGVPEPTAIAVALLLVISVGIANGLLVAFLEIPPIFVTLATALLIIGAGQAVLVQSTVVYMPADAYLLPILGQSRLLGLPVQIFVAVTVLLLGHIFLKYTRFGRFTYAQGDNVETARLTGMETRPMILLHYLLAALIAFAGGLLLAGANPTFSFRASDSSLLFDVVLVVVLGGVSLAGGSGSVRSVIAGTLLIGILLNGMTILNFPQQWQDLVKGIVLLAAIILDATLHPRDEETSRQSDI